MECQDEYEQESPLPEGWTLFGSDDELSMSSLSDGENELFVPTCSTSDEDLEAEVSAPIVGASLAQNLHYSLQHMEIYKHVVSGCCHISKDTCIDDDDGETVVLRCGKIATRNFQRVVDVGNFMPYKCTRCFSNVGD